MSNSSVFSIDKDWRPVKIHEEVRRPQSREGVWAAECAPEGRIGTFREDSSFCFWRRPAPDEQGRAKDDTKAYAGGRSRRPSWRSPSRRRPPPTRRRSPSSSTARPTSGRSPRPASRRRRASCPNYDLQFKYPEQAAAAVQQRVMEDLVAAGAAGIMVSAVDPKNQTEGLEQDRLPDRALHHRQRRPASRSASPISARPTPISARKPAS